MFKKFNNIQKNLVVLNDYKELLKVFHFNNHPLLDNEEFLYEYKYVQDVNERRLKDAQSLHVLSANIFNGKILEIGTSEGYSTHLLAKNSPTSSIYTLNILPDDISNAGKNVTHFLEKEKIGWYYKKFDYKNIFQIYANSLTWKPDINGISLAFIDGCHDYKFIINDTLKSLSILKGGGFVAWHDFNFELKDNYNWILDTCRAIEYLLKKKHISGPIFHVKDSWVLIWKSNV